VAVHIRTKEQQKDLIFDTFSKYRSEPSSDCIKAYQILCDQIYRWYRDHLNIDADEAGLAIAQVINRFLKVETISNVPQDKDGFFKYLNVSIKTEKASLNLEYGERDIIKIPKEKNRKLRKVDDFIRMKESHLGRKLTNDEIMQGVSEWFNKQEYVDLLISKNVGSISGHDGNNEIDVLNPTVVSIYNSNAVDNPLDEYIKKTDMENVREAVESELDKIQERARDCYRALFTLYCIENYRDFEELYPVLDKSVIETCKNGKNPNQYEIYQKYHPKAKKSGAEAMASKNLKEFLNNIETRLNKKNP